MPRTRYMTVRRDGRPLDVEYEVHGEDEPDVDAGPEITIVRATWADNGAPCQLSDEALGEVAADVCANYEPDYQED